jgi:phosphopantothenoylcysteine decarboxylase/phosphopantothenate--cysteine ligase
LVGFAAETLTGEELVSSARKKLHSKNVDLIVANDVSGGAVFGDEATSIKLVSANSESSFDGTKLEAANVIVNWITDSRK